MEYIFEDELYHHGIKGMHWGVRRYQNADGSYTPAGRARYGIGSDGKMSSQGLDQYIKDNRTSKEKLSKQYKKHSVKALSSMARRETDLYVQSYNNAANRMNNGLTDKYNNDYAKKLGSKAKNHDYANDKKYVEGYEKLFEKIFKEEDEKVKAAYLTKNKDYQKAVALLEKYSMYTFDDLAKENKSFDDYLRKKKYI